MAEVDKLSTSVSIKHTYFPPWFSWMLRIIRSPETLWKGKRVLDKIRLSKLCRVYFITWNWRRVNINALQKPHRLQATGFFFVVVVASLQTPATDTADVLSTNNAVGCPSGAPRRQANPNAATHPAAPRKQQTATRRTPGINIAQLIGKAILIIL